MKYMNKSVSRKNFKKTYCTIFPFLAQTVARPPETYPAQALLPASPGPEWRKKKAFRCIILHVTWLVAPLSRVRFCEFCHATFSHLLLLLLLLYSLLNQKPPIWRTAVWRVRHISPIWRFWWFTYNVSLTFHDQVFSMLLEWLLYIIICMKLSHM